MEGMVNLVNGAEGVISDVRKKKSMGGQIKG